MTHNTNTCPDRYSINGTLTCPHQPNQPTSVVI